MKISSKPLRFGGLLCFRGQSYLPQLPPISYFDLLSVSNFKMQAGTPCSEQIRCPKAGSLPEGPSNLVILFVSLPENNVFLSFRGCWILYRDIENVTELPSPILLSVLLGASFTFWKLLE